MADMVELAADSNGDTKSETNSKESKQNGDVVNGSVTHNNDDDDDSIMDVDETPAVTKKVVNNEIVNNKSKEDDKEQDEEEEDESNDKSEVEDIDEEEEEDTKSKDNDDIEKNGEENGKTDDIDDKIESSSVDNDKESVSNDKDEKMSVDDEEEDEYEDSVDVKTDKDITTDPIKKSEEENNDVDDSHVVDDDDEDKKDEDGAKSNELKDDKDVKEGGGGDNGDDDDIMEVDGETDKKLNGSSDDKSGDLSDDTSDKTNESGNGDDGSTPKKGKKSSTTAAAVNLTPRRSSRNLNKSHSYKEKEEKDIIELVEDDSTTTPNKSKKKQFDDDIQEISAVDPLADPLTTTIKPKSNNVKPILIDTKRLSDITQVGGGLNAKNINMIKQQQQLQQQQQQQQMNNKKEPTLVIIDTNSILSGRGPVPVAHSTPHQINRNPQLTMVPVHKSGQGMNLSNKSNISMTPSKPTSMSSSTTTSLQQQQQQQQQIEQAKNLLPTLTDDMFVVEAPSFIVPYVYEKPPVKQLKEFVEDLDKTIKKEKEDVEKEKLKEKETKKLKEEEDKKEKEKEDDDDEKSDEKMEEDKDDDDEKEDKDKESKKEIDTKDSIDKDKEESDKDKVKEEDSSDVKTESTDSKSNDDIKVIEEKKTTPPTTTSTSNSYFDNPLGKFFMHIGINLVQEQVQADLLKSQKRKRDREGTKVSSDTLSAISSLEKTLEFSKENNDPFRYDVKKCEYCNFKTESKLVMAHHLETPHMKNYIYRCNFCPLEVRSPHDIMFHMEAEHNVRGRLEKAPAFHQCPSCLFEDNQKGKLTRHLLSCAKKYRPERNQEPPLDWEPPAKIPRVSRRPTNNNMNPGNAVYAAAMTGLKQGGVGGNQVNMLPKMMQMAAAQGGSAAAAAAAMSQALLNRQRGRPLGANTTPGLLYRPTGPNAQNIVLPPGYQIQGGQIFQSPKSSQHSTSSAAQTQNQSSANKLLNQPSISITPLPRAQPGSSSQNNTPMPAHAKPGRPQPPGGTGKNTFVICEICDGYIKDLEQLRNHMQWIHKVKIHPKMIYNRPPLNCQKCQFRFFTDQGLERHLLGSHGLVTSSMQEAANKGKDGGRCPVCGRVYQWKLLNHVARDHNMSLKPAHLSYKCTVCTATFGMYRQFENHVYSAHSVAPKRPADKKPSSSSSPSQNDPLLKPLKINDEITIIPQPPRPSGSSSGNSNKAKITPVPNKK